ncbi:MAG: TVP38/TMEM64 family protein [Lachnospiraceae bacterium]|nr:TVP38/TMEM64 family protein [Candidatus Merdinaster equi]
MREDSVKQTKSKEKKQLTKKQQKIIAGIGIAVFVLVVVVLCIVAIPLIKSLADPDNPEARESFRKWVNEMGIWGRLAYMGLMILQILVAFIPGEPLELMAGYAFGTVEGTILCLLASSIGSILVLLLVRKFGVYLLEIFFSKEKIDSLKFLQESPRTTLIFTVLFIPIGTPKDLLCFYGGLTKIRMWILILVCTLGRFPAIITSTLGGDALENQDFVAAIIVLAVTLALSGIGILVYKLVSRKNDKNQAPVTATGTDSDLDKDKN